MDRERERPSNACRLLLWGGGAKEVYAKDNKRQKKSHLGNSTILRPKKAFGAIPYGI